MSHSSFFSFQFIWQTFSHGLRGMLREQSHNKLAWDQIIMIDKSALHIGNTYILDDILPASFLW